MASVKFAAFENKCILIFLNKRNVDIFMLMVFTFQCCLALKVEDATKALEATNGTALEKNGQILRVAYAKSILGPGSGASGASQSSSLAAAAIEAATFAQQVCFLSFSCYMLYGSHALINRETSSCTICWSFYFDH